MLSVEEAFERVCAEFIERPTLVSSAVLDYPHHVVLLVVKHHDGSTSAHALSNCRMSNTMIRG